MLVCKDWLKSCAAFLHILGAYHNIRMAWKFDFLFTSSYLCNIVAKILTFGKPQINLVFRSLNRIFAKK